MALEFLVRLWRRLTGQNGDDEESSRTPRGRASQYSTSTSNQATVRVYSPQPTVPSRPLRIPDPPRITTYIEPTISLPDVRYRFVYRLLRDSESTTNGINAKVPYANVSIETHVAYGSRCSSQYISTSASKYAIKKLIGVKTYGALHNIRVVKIDLAKMKKLSPSTDIIDLTDYTNVRRHLTSARSRKFASNFEEVLIHGHVPESAVTLIYQGPKSRIWDDDEWS